jgi:hypothetical protein
MTTPEPQAGDPAAGQALWADRSALLVTTPAPELELAPACSEIRTPFELARLSLPEPDPEAGLGHDYDGPELQSGTPEYEALYAEYQAWAAQPEPEPEWDCADSNAYQARVEAGLEPEAEL